MVNQSEDLDKTARPKGTRSRTAFIGVLSVLEVLAESVDDSMAKYEAKLPQDAKDFPRMVEEQKGLTPESTGLFF